MKLLKRIMCRIMNHLLPVEIVVRDGTLLHWLFEWLYGHTGPYRAGCRES